MKTVRPALLGAILLIAGVSGWAIEPVEEARAAFEGGEISRPFFVASGHDDASQRPMLAISRDGADFQRITPFNYNPPAGDDCRDCSLMRWKGRYYLTYTAGIFGKASYFGIAVSDDLINWAFYTNVNVPSNAFYTWAPEWCVDGDDVYVVYGADSGTGGWSLFYVKALDDTLTQWSGRSPIGGTETYAVFSQIDPQVIRFHHAWLLVCRPYGPGGYGAEVFRSTTSPVAGYTLLSRPEWGAHTNEGQCLTNLGGGKLRLYSILDPGLPEIKMTFADTMDGGLTFGESRQITGNFPAPHMTVIGFDADSLPELKLERTGENVKVHYSSMDNFTMETSTTLRNWRSVTPAFDDTSSEWWLEQSAAADSLRFWRLRKTP